MLLNGLDGLVCSLLLYSSGLFGALNQFVLEFSTPQNVAPTSMLFCFNDTSVSINISSFSVVSLKVGGSLFNYSVQQVPISPIWTQSAFFLSGAAGSSTPPAAFGIVRDVLSSDPYYGSSFLNQRYDDMGMDWQGQDISGILGYPSSPVSRPQPVNSSGNCVLLTGAWQAGTRYELTLQMSNPVAQNPAGLSEPMATLWLAPVTVQATPVPSYQVNGTKSATAASLDSEFVFSVRGNKYGTLCSIRYQAAVLGMLYDACKYLSRFTLGPFPVNGTQQSCAAGLAALANPLNADVFPFNQPPVRNYTLDSFGQSSCGGAVNTALSLRYGGQCVSCGTGASGATLHSPCQCSANVQQALVGNVACGPPLSADGSAESMASLSASLCNEYSGAQLKWQNRTLPSKVVTSLMLKAFFKAAALLMDESDVQAANITFYANYIHDNRRPNSPTRTYGIAPICSECNQSTTFKNVVSSEKPTPVYDYQFQAMNTFRLIGYLLNTVAHFSCPTLWDKYSPLALDYGYYIDKLCQPLPPLLGNFPIAGYSTSN